MSLTAVLFLAAFGSCLLLALVRAPIFGLYAYVATFYLHPVDRWWGQDLPDLRWSLMAAAVALAASFRLPADPARPAFTATGGGRFVLLMCLWLWVQWLWALSPTEHLDLALLFTKYVVLFYLVYRLLVTEADLRGFLLVHVLGCLYLGWLVIQAPDSGRLEGVGGPGIDEANALGMQLGTGSFAAAILLFGDRTWSRALALLSLPLILNGFIQTESRGAFLGLSVAGLAFLALNPGHLRRRWLVLGALAVVLMLPLVPAGYWERMGTISAAADDPEAADTSVQTRLDLIKAQWQMFARYPAGTGHRGTAYLSAQYLRDDQLTQSKKNPLAARARSSHNTVMTAITEQGVPGALLYGGVLLWAWRRTRDLAGRARDSGQDGVAQLVAVAGATLAMVVAAGQFTDYFKAEVFIWGLAWLAALDALAATASTRSEAAVADESPAVPGPRLGPWPKPGA